MCSVKPQSDGEGSGAKHLSCLEENNAGNDCSKNAKYLVIQITESSA